MTLPATFQIRILNNTATTIDFSAANSAKIVVQYWKWASDGSREYSTGGETDTFSANTNLVAGAAQAFEKDNSTTKWVGFHATATVVNANAAGADGAVEYRFEAAPNGVGGEYPSSAADFDERLDTQLLASVPIVGLQTRARNAEL